MSNALAAPRSCSAVLSELICRVIGALASPRRYWANLGRSPCNNETCTMPSSEPMEVHVGVAGLNRGSLKLHTDGRQFQRLSPSVQEYVVVRGPVLA